MRANRTELEMNELRWWSRWAGLEWIDGRTYVLSSTEFREPFFNRAGLLSCARAQWSLKSLLSRRSPPRNVTIPHPCEAGRRLLARSGYRLADRMTVLGLSKPTFRVNPEVLVSRVWEADAEEWSRVYLVAFYGSTRNLSKVVRIVRKLVRSAESALLLGTVEGGAAGCLALQRSGRSVGVYCVGTLPRFRRLGVAGTLISHAYDVALSEGRRVFLQTLKSDAAEDFYLAGGFSRLYVKDILTSER